MASDKKASYEISADGSGFVSEMSKVAASAKHATAEMQERFEALNATIERVSKAMGAVAAIAVGGAGFEHIIQATSDWALKQDELAKKMGLTAKEAAAYQVATEKLGIDSNVLIVASDKLAKSVQTNTGAFEALGIETKNANGGWKSSAELLPDVIEKLQGIDNPMQRAIAGQKLFGKGFNEIIPLLRMTKEDLTEAAGKVDSLGLAMDADQVRAYKASLSEVELVGKSLEFQIGSALMPTLSQVGDYFANAGPELSKQFAEALGFLSKSVATLVMTFEALGKMIGGVLAAVNAAVHGNLTQARQIMSDTIDDINKIDEAYQKLWQDAAKPLPAAAKRPKDDTPALDLDNDKQSKSRMAQWEDELAAERVKFAEEHNLIEQSKADELSYWEEKRRAANLTDAEVLSLDRKIADTRLAMLREQRSTEKALSEEQITETEKAGLDALNARRATLQSELALGNIHKDELLAQEIALEDQRLALQTKALQDRAALLRDDPDRNAVALAKIQDEILDQTRAHDLKIQEINAEAAKNAEFNWQHVADSLTSSFAGITKGLISGTESIRGAFTKLFQGILDLAVNVVSKILENLAVTAIQENVIGGTSRAAQVTGQAAVGAAGAFAATAAIPYVGPELAPAAAASAYTGIMSFLPQASAFGGFDIPSGINPVTQLHAEEMVLPAKLANPLRESLDGGGLGGSQMPDIHIHAMDGADVRRVLMSNKKHLADAIRAAHRGAHI